MARLPPRAIVGLFQTLRRGYEYLHQLRLDVKKKKPAAANICTIHQLENELAATVQTVVSSSWSRIEMSKA